MIIKNLSRKSNSGQLLRYICRYILDPQKQDIEKGSFIIRHNIRGTNIKSYVKEFADNNSNRLFKRKDQAVIQHIILSWSSKDSHLMNDKMLRDLTKKFIQLRGANNCYIGSKHMDRNHLHIHLAMSAVQINGRSSRISKAQFEELKVKLDEYQAHRYPQLSNSLPEHGKIRESKLYRHDQVEKLQSVILETSHKASSLNAFVKSLDSENMQPYYRAGKLQGVIYGNQKYRFSTLGISGERLSQLAEIKSPYAPELEELSRLRTKANERTINQQEVIRERVLTKDIQ